MFLLYNLLTEAESVVRQHRIRPNFFAEFTLGLLKNFIVTINKIASIDRFHKIETKWRINFSTTHYLSAISDWTLDYVVLILPFYSNSYNTTAYS